MSNNLTSITGGLGTSIQQDSPLSIRPFDTLIVSPQASASSSTTPASTVSQKTVSMWVENTQNIPLYVLESQTNIWALTFPTSTTYVGQPACIFDCLRNATLTFSTATTNDTTVTISGFDDKGKAVVWTSGNLVAGSTTVSSTKCFLIIQNVTFTAPPWAINSDTYTVLVRGGLLIGLPCFINLTDSVISATWNEISIIDDVVAGAIWRQTAITPPITSSTVPLATSIDARGYVDLTSTGTAPNGIVRLFVHYYVYGLDEKINEQLSYINGWTTTGAYNINKSPGSSAQIVKIRTSSLGNAMLTSLVSQDRYGAQFPGDNDFMATYNSLYYKV
jgi:hypothetical protein